MTVVVNQRRVTQLQIGISRTAGYLVWLRSNIERWQYWWLLKNRWLVVVVGDSL